MPLPVVAGEVQRVAAAFTAVSAELSAAVALLAEVGSPRVGTAAADAAVSTGLDDLRAVLSGWEVAAEACAQAVGRHPDLVAPAPAVIPAETATDTGAAQEADGAG